MNLSHILYPSETRRDLNLSIPVAKPCQSVSSLAPGDVYFASRREHIQDAVNMGASAIVADESAWTDIPLPIPVFPVKNVRRQYALAWSRYTGHPERALRLIAVTGTNGKTSVTVFLCSLLRALGYKTGLIGTTLCSDGVHTEPSDYTTPPPEILYPLLARMRANGVTYAVMEASSHALTQERLFGLRFACAIFTNLTRDHLDYHGTYERYAAAKASLFTMAEHSLLFHSDPSARRMAFDAAGDVFYYGEHPLAEFEIRDPLISGEGIRYTLVSDGTELPVRLPLYGRFHIANTAAALACTIILGEAPSALADAIPHMRTPTGRMERLATDTPYAVYLDYAHSPDALTQALSSLRPLTRRLTVLFGAGGERDRGKRPQMGRAAAELADLIILTNDNPRNEDPNRILSDIMEGIPDSKAVICIPDRETAIRYALDTAQADDILLFAGKGHEAYLIDENGKHPFSEREIVRKYLERKGT